MTRYIILYLLGLALAEITVSGEPRIRNRHTLAVLWPVMLALIVVLDVRTLIQILFTRDKE